MLQITVFFFLFLTEFSSLMAEKCEFTYDPNKTTLEWTAFKFSEKTGVKGKIESFKVSKSKKSESVLDSLKSIEFTIQTETVNSGVPDRDGKIRAHLLGSISKGKDIKGTVGKISGGPQGTANFNLEWNGIKKQIPVTYTVADTTLEVKGMLSVIDFGLGEGLKKLNEVCTDLHKGSDGVSKLWPEVEFRVVSELSKDCK